MSTFVDDDAVGVTPGPDKLYASTPTKIQRVVARDAIPKILGEPRSIFLGALDLVAIKIPAVLTLTADDNVISIFLKLFPSAEITIEW